MTSGWLPHDGGKCPVDPDTLVRVRFRDGHQAMSVPAALWSRRPNQWRHRNSPFDIIAYREETEE